MRVIIISGANNSGKDQFVNFFMENYKYKSVNMSTIDRVKEISKKYFDWDGKKTESSRKFLSDIKKAWSEYNNGPFIYMKKQIKKHYLELSKKDKKKFVFFVHCREPEEIQKFKDFYKNKCTTILIVIEKRTEKNKIANNTSDMNVNNYEYDKIIFNNGNKIDLKLESINFIKKEMK